MFLLSGGPPTVAQVGAGEGDLMVPLVVEEEVCVGGAGRWRPGGG